MHPPLLMSQLVPVSAAVSSCYNGFMIDEHSAFNAIAVADHGMETMVGFDVP